MKETIQLDDIHVVITRKNVKNVHLSVHPPEGSVTLVVPKSTRLAVARAYVVSKLSWIHKQREKLLAQKRESSRQFRSRESHFVWGKRYLMTVIECEQKPCVTMDHRSITLVIRPGSDRAKRESVMHAWHKELLHAEVPRLIRKWEKSLQVKVETYYLQRMKTKWGSCNHKWRHIRLNTELVKKPKDLLEYVVVHEMAHLIEPTHSARYIEILNKHYPTWREARFELNELPISDDLDRRGSNLLRAG